jgi:putative flavoprotein involved in K+ transport
MAPPTFGLPIPEEMLLMHEVLAEAPDRPAAVLEPVILVVSQWLDALKGATSAANASAVAHLFDPQATFRDLLALSWDLRNAVGREEIATLIAGAASSTTVEIEVRPGNERFLDLKDGRIGAESFLLFRSDVGAGEGYVQLVADETGTWRATAFVLALGSLDSHPAQLGESRPLGRVHGPIPNRVGWQERLDHDFTAGDPSVLILGAGHNGLMLAARLRVLGISALIVDRNERIGDNWRKRYNSLALHTPLASDQMPYIPFPSTWTRFTPKDKLGDFLECYAKLLDLAVWTSSRVENVHYDDQTKRWTLDVIRQDGSRRTMTPEHLVFATGMNGEPYMPELPGHADYRGTLIHAVEYRGHSEWEGKKAVVVGSGVSGHDLAQDLAEHGVDVTMIQRSGTVVMNTSSFHAVMHPKHISGIYSTEEADLINAATPFGMLPLQGAEQLAMANEMDRDLLNGLTEAGFELSQGPDGQGVLGLIFGQNATGYYFNAGASELIADGTIKLRHGSVTGLTVNGVALDDGSEIDADLVIFATGYRGATTAIRDVLGDEIADNLGEFANVSGDREFGRLWRRSGMDRLWFMITLGLDAGRFYSKLLSLQIAAIEAGTMPISAD